MKFKQGDRVVVMRKLGYGTPCDNSVFWIDCAMDARLGATFVVKQTAPKPRSCLDPVSDCWFFEGCLEPAPMGNEED